MRTPLLLAVFFTAALGAPAQTFTLSNPLRITPVLSGSFSELRGNHFHGGIDLKTQGKSGLDVLAAADGSIVRISISPYGYGNALYLKHPEGYTTVYGHLQAFAPEVEAWVEAQLIDRNKNDGNLYPVAGQFEFKRGERIAFSGNTGGSMGPHLHFEIRETATEEPLNPLAFGIEVADHRAPNLWEVRLMGAPSSRIQSVHDGDTLTTDELVGVEIRATDRQDGANNNNGLHQISMAVNGQQTGSIVYDRLNFSTTRYINAHINYPQYFASGQRFIRLYALENNALKLHRFESLEMPWGESRDGRLFVLPGQVVQVDLKVEDLAGNQSGMHFYIRGEAGAPLSEAAPVLSWSQSHELELGPVAISLPKGVLYENTRFPLAVLSNGEYVIGGGSIPLQAHMVLRWKLDETEATLDRWFAWEFGRNGGKDALVGKREGDFITFETRSTGRYVLDRDVQAPTVRLVQHTPLQRSNSAFREIRVSAADDKTGIERYSARIDEEFARIDFDYKRGLLKIVVPPQMRSGSHNLRVVCIDGAGNTATLESTIVL